MSQGVIRESDHAAQDFAAAANSGVHAVIKDAVIHPAVCTRRNRTCECERAGPILTRSVLSGRCEEAKHLLSSEGDPPPTARRDMVVFPLGQRGGLHEAA